MPPDIQLYNQEVDLRAQMLISLINGHNPVPDDNSGGMDGLGERISLLRRELKEKSRFLLCLLKDFPLGKGGNKPGMAVLR
ncbi:MAG: hypothetical protein HY274_01130 [Gammaproteobacteria bacterium]|nr:hypothetical protein [Gammaproteobacteria bacterium]